MAIEKALLLIADIGGYTRFMKQHRFSLAHAQDTVAQLLEAVIDAAGRFKLAKLEGDAAFFYAVGDDVTAFARQVADIRSAFVARREQLILDRMCKCDGCMQVSALTLKFVAHAGEVAFQKVKHLTELAGVDVILVHRMLKNDVSTALPTALGPSLPRKLWSKLALEVRSLKYVLGLKEPCQDFRNVEVAIFPNASDPWGLPARSAPRSSPRSPIRRTRPAR